MSGGGHSSVPAADWLPILERLIEGVGHAVSNRSAALTGAAQLFELRLTSLEEGARLLGTESQALREQVELLRTLGRAATGDRQPVRAGDALRLGVSMLAQDREMRVHRYDLVPEPADVPPLLLWRADHLRLGVLTLMAVSESARDPMTVRVSVARAPEGLVRITALAPIPIDALRGSASYQLLSRFATAEGGNASSAAAPDGATALELSLPGLGSASARREP